MEQSPRILQAPDGVPPNVAGTSGSPRMLQAPVEEPNHWWHPLTARSLFVGSLIGTVTTMQNIYFSLKYGWTVSNNIAAAIIGFVLFSSLKKMFPSMQTFTAEENCVLMTVAVSGTACVWGGSLPFAVLAMSDNIRIAVALPGDEVTDTWEPSIGKLFVYCAGFCYVGFFLAIPLRRKFVIQQPLTFPYAVAAAKTISSLHGGGDASSGAGAMLLRGLVPAFIWGMVSWCIDGLERFPVFGNHLSSKYSWRMNLSAAPFGQGFIVPARFVLSQAFGAFIAFGIFYPVALQHEGTWFKSGATGFTGAQAYTTVPAIFVIAFDSVYQLGKLFLTLFALPMYRQSRAGRNAISTDNDAIEQLVGGNADNDAIEHNEFGNAPGVPPAFLDGQGRKVDNEHCGDVPALVDELVVPTRFWLGGWGVSTVIAAAVFWKMFGCSWPMLVLACLSAPLWSVGITKAVGTTGSNVASYCGKLMIIVFASWYGSAGKVVPVLALGALSTAVIDQALDLVRDFKTAELVKASPKAMLAAQVFGSTLSIATASVIYSVYVNNIQLPTTSMPAVLAKSYRALAFVFAGGFSALPTNCLVFSLASGTGALVLSALHDLAPQSIAKWVPSSIAIGVGAILGFGQSMASLCGLGCFTLWKRLDPVRAGQVAELLGAGILAGDGLAGVVQSILEVCGIDHPTSFDWT